MSNLNPTEISQVVTLLQKLEPGFLPKDIFLEVARLVTTPVIELVPLRLNDGEVEVLLLKRDEDDKHWPGMLHTPGTVIRSTDTFATAFERLVADELNNSKVGEMKFIDKELIPTERGKAIAFIYYTEIKDSSIGEFHKVNSLPSNLVGLQIAFIKKAAELFST